MRAWVWQLTRTVLLVLAEHTSAHRHTYIPLPSKLSGQHLRRSRVATLCWAHHLCFSLQKDSKASVDRATTATIAGLSQCLAQLHCCKHTVSCLSSFFSEFDFSIQSLLLITPFSQDQITLNVTISFSEDINAQYTSCRAKETPYHLGQSVTGLCTLFAFQKKPKASESKSAH